MRLALVVLAACGAHPAPAPATAPAPVTPAPIEPAIGDTCTADADCVVTNFPGCCACPQCNVAQPRARSKSELAREQQTCTVVECDMHACDIGGMCPPGEDAAHFTAHCTNQVCVAVHR
jgi:hypothetical protein